MTTTAKRRSEPNVSWKSFLDLAQPCEAGREGVAVYRKTGFPITVATLRMLRENSRCFYGAKVIAGMIRAMPAKERLKIFNQRLNSLVGNGYLSTFFVKGDKLQIAEVLMSYKFGAMAMFALTATGKDKATAIYIYLESDLKDRMLNSNESEEVKCVTFCQEVVATYVATRKNKKGK